MKKLSWFNKIMYFFNVVLAILTVVAYILPYLTPKLFPFLSVFTLVMPLMLILNFLFFIYWLMQIKRQMLLSGLVLLAGITFINRCYRFSGEKLPKSPDDFTVMSYNVRMFNVYNWIRRKDIADTINDFVEKENPDVLCLQEYSRVGEHFFTKYAYKYIYVVEGKSGNSIYSRFPILSKGELDFQDSGNEVIYADILKGKDTVRIYSMHMQSVKISPDIHESIDEEKSKMIVKRLSIAFRKQQEQAVLLSQNREKCPYTTIICGDLNNSAFSYVYRTVKGDMQDAFEEAGKGFGKSYDYPYYPARIDYILADDNIQIKEFETFNNFVNSDHFPVMARLAFKKESKKQ